MARGKDNLISIRNLTKGKPPRLPFVEIAREILGKKYELSLVFVGSKKSRALNWQFRKKNKPANVLSFPLGKLEGEIFIDLSEAKKQKFSVLHLYIHGLLHLKGLYHGSKMDRAEERFIKKFGS